MAQLKVHADNFNLNSTYNCVSVSKSWKDRDTGDLIDYTRLYSTGTSTPTRATKNVVFNFDLPTGAVVTGAKMYATLGNSLTGAQTSTINGVPVREAATAAVDVAVGDGVTSVSVDCVFVANPTWHEHIRTDNATVTTTLEYEEYCVVVTETWTKQHTGSLSYTDVYLLIDYKPAVEFSGWTDDPLTAGETFVKAVHMTEMQEWAALLSEYADNGTPTFTPAVPGDTSLALWLSQVEEIRAVLDVICPTHEDWIDVSVNCPRADVMTQIRSIIVSAM